jgi:hypothetical protein
MNYSSATIHQLPIFNIIACGALAKELIALKALNQWQQINISCLPAKYHNTPKLIPDAVDKKIVFIKSQNDGKILIAYGDCGTGGLLDVVIEKHNLLQENHIERLPGAHCYQFFAGQQAFTDIQEEEIGSFYLTDFLVNQFESYVWKSLGLDKHPELLELYFSNYKRLVFLAQTNNEKLTQLAETCAKRLNLNFERIYTGYGDLGKTLNQFKTGVIPIVQIISSDEDDKISFQPQAKLYA